MSFTCPKFTKPEAHGYNGNDRGDLTTVERKHSLLLSWRGDFPRLESLLTETLSVLGGGKDPLNHVTLSRTGSVILPMNANVSLPAISLQTL